jgi:hypothetical protein
MHYLIGPRDERTQPVRIVPGYPQTPWRNPKEPLGRRAPSLAELTGPAPTRCRPGTAGGGRRTSTSRSSARCGCSAWHETPFFDD